LKKLNLLFCVAGVVSISIIIYFVIQYYQRPDYVLDVDAMREDQSLFTNTRIILTNAGKEQITNMTVFYGVKNETIQTINPGEKISLSPPEGSNLNVVRIIADNGINITAGYRTPIKMPGMMGS
jgi:acyl-CoA thioesterase